MKKIARILLIGILMFCMEGCGTKEAEINQEEITKDAENVEVEQVESEQEEAYGMDEEGEDEEQNNSSVKKMAETTVVLDDINSFADYMLNLEDGKTAVVVFNETSGEVTNIQDGEMYQLKADDRIFTKAWDEMAFSGNGLLDAEGEVHGVYNTNGKYAEFGTVDKSVFCAWEYVPDYSMYEAGEEVESIYGSGRKDEDLEYIQVYFVTPIGTDAGSVKEEMPGDYERYLEKLDGERLLGFHIPEGFKEDTEVSNAGNEERKKGEAQFYRMGERIRIFWARVDTYYNYATLYERGISPEGTECIEKGTVETPYGEVKIYDEIISYDFADADGNATAGQARYNLGIFKWNGNIFVITYEDWNDTYYDSVDMTQYQDDLTPLLEELF